MLITEVMPSQRIRRLVLFLWSDMQKNTSYNIGSFQAERSLIIYLDYLRKSEFLSAKKILLSFFLQRNKLYPRKIQ